MRIADSILPEFDQEMGNTRKYLERVPNEQLEWQPHDRSMTLRALTTHLANLPSWVGLAIGEDSFDVNPPGKEPPRTEPVASVAAALDVFDRNVADARAVIDGATDDRLLAPWTLLNAGETVFSLPRIAVIRTMVMSHLVHHRGQLSVYLRLHDVPVPAIYGPTADESM